MGRWAKIDRELAREYRQIETMERDKRQRERARDRLLQSGLQNMADIEQAMIDHLKRRIEEEQARIAGKNEIRDKPDDVTTTEIIEREVIALDEKRARRDALLRLQTRTAEQTAELERLNREIALEGYKIEGKEIAGRVAGEYAMGAIDDAGGYRVAVYDPSGEEIFALLLPAGRTPVFEGTPPVRATQRESISERPAARPTRQRARRRG